MVVSRTGEVDLERDRALVERAQHGDETAFADLYLLYRERLFRACLGKLGNPSEAEDVVQESFTRAFTALPRLAGERKFYPWLSVIAAHLCIDLLREKGRLVRLEEEAPPVPDPASGSEQESLVESRERDALVQRALDRLSPRHREVLELREREEWSYRRIASHSGVEVSTVETLLYRARRSLRRELLLLRRSEGPLGILLLPLVAARAAGRQVARLASASGERLAAAVSAVPTPTLAGTAAATVTAVVLTTGAVLGTHPGRTEEPAGRAAMPTVGATAPVPVTTSPSSAGTRSVTRDPREETAPGERTPHRTTASLGHEVAGGATVADAAGGAVATTVSSASSSISRGTSSLSHSAGSFLSHTTGTATSLVSGSRSGLSHLTGGLAGVSTGGGGLLSDVNAATSQASTDLGSSLTGLGSVASEAGSSLESGLSGTGSPLPQSVAGAATSAVGTLSDGVSGLSSALEAAAPPALRP